MRSRYLSVKGRLYRWNTDETGAIATYVGNGTEQYHTLGYLVFPGEGGLLWYDYVNHRGYPRFDRWNKVVVEWADHHRTGAMDGRSS